MSILSIPNTHVNGTPADATDVNENMAAVAAIVNGLLDDDNINLLSEDKVVFDGTGGHDHSGGTAGKVIPLAVNNGAAGLLKYKSGSVSIADGANAAITYSGVAFTATPMIKVTWGSTKSDAQPLGS